MHLLVVGLPFFDRPSLNHVDFCFVVGDGDVHFRRLDDLRVVGQHLQGLVPVGQSVNYVLATIAVDRLVDAVDHTGKPFRLELRHALHQVSAFIQDIGGFVERTRDPGADHAVLKALLFVAQVFLQGFREMVLELRIPQQEGRLHGRAFRLCIERLLIHLRWVHQAVVEICPDEQVPPLKGIKILRHGFLHAWRRHGVSALR